MPTPLLSIGPTHTLVAGISYALPVKQVVADYTGSIETSVDGSAWTAVGASPRTLSGLFVRSTAGSTIVLRASGESTGSGSGSGSGGDWTNVSHGDLVFSDNGAGVWTVQEADVEVFRYMINGKVVHLHISIQNTSLTATATVLTITTPFNFKSVVAVYVPIITTNVGIMTFGALGWTGLGELNFFPNLTAPANWNIATNNTGFMFNGTIELV